MQLTATPWKESSGVCECCGQTSRTVWGDVSAADQTLAVYYVSWTKGSAKHPPSIDLVIGPWGDGATPDKRVLVSLLFRPGPDGGSFMVIDGDTRLEKKRDLCGRALKRTEVIGTPMAQEAFALVDALWVGDPRLEEVRQLNNDA